MSVQTRIADFLAHANRVADDFVVAATSRNMASCEDLEFDIRMCGQQAHVIAKEFFHATPKAEHKAVWRQLSDISGKIHDVTKFLRTPSLGEDGWLLANKCAKSGSQFENAGDLSLDITGKVDVEVAPATAEAMVDVQVATASDGATEVEVAAAEEPSVRSGPDNHTHHFSTPTDARRFALTGSVQLTLKSNRTGISFVYKVKKGSPRTIGDHQVWFVSLLRDGMDAYLGVLDDSGFRVTSRSCASQDSQPARAFAYFWKHLREGRFAADLDILHAGRCGCCNRKLTGPEIGTGFGPTCGARIGVPKQDRVSRAASEPVLFKPNFECLEAYFA